MRFATLLDRHERGDPSRLEAAEMPGITERTFRRWRERLPKELRLAGITGLEATNRWLREVYLPARNAAFAVPAEQEGTAFVPDGIGARRNPRCASTNTRTT
ncbi:MAG TPA: hypothetical protein VK943_10995 [Arenibaculum sp.]|nr:hypothetical protein [Arenibaculum sp.]